MSQIFNPNVTSSNLPPEVPESFVTDSGAAVAAAHVLNVPGGTVTDNVTNGIKTFGSGNNLSIKLTNRITGSATTTDGVTPVNLLTFPLGATPGTYLFRSYVTAYNLTDSLGATYSSFASVRTSGAAGTLLTTGNFFVSEEGAMSVLDVANDVSANTLTIDVIGIAGKTIHFVALNEYIFVS